MLRGEVANAAWSGKGQEEGRARRQKQTGGSKAVSWGRARGCRRCIVAVIAVQCSAAGLGAMLQRRAAAALPPDCPPRSPETMLCFARQRARARHFLHARLERVPTRRGGQLTGTSDQPLRARGRREIGCTPFIWLHVGCTLSFWLHLGRGENTNRIRAASCAVGGAGPPGSHPATQPRNDASSSILCFLRQSAGDC
jgi:hypothetical protein